MYILEKIKTDIAEEINKALNKQVVKAPDLVYPPASEMGDLSWACFNLAKELGKSPAEIASRLAKELSSGYPELSSASFVKVVGPYLNFTLNKGYLAKNVIKEIERGKNKHGENKNGGGKRTMIEYSNANTHKEYHVGHLRNISYGDSVARILSANGYKVIPVSYINDFGIHVAKTLWAYNKFFKNEPLPENKGYFLGKIYARATRELAADPDIKREVEELMKKIESRKGEEYKLWKKTRKWSIEQFDKIYGELGVKFKKFFYENEFISDGFKMVQELLQEGILEKSEGAIIANLEGYDNLSVLMFLRSDGTALYPVADIPLAIKKNKKYKLDRSIYVVDIRQSLYFRQLFKVLELMDYASATLRVGRPEMIHLGYEFVKLPSGMMSSRTGNIITYEDLRNEVFKKAEEETRKRHKDWKEEKIKKVAAKIAVGAMKFEMLKMGRLQTITFNINEALRFDGFTAAYLQYTYARIKSINKKARKQESKKANFNYLAEAKEHDLIMKLAKYPEAVAKAGERYDPSEIAKYIFELARDFNDYYHSIPVLKAEAEMRKARLALIGSASQVIKNGLNLLGIETMEEM